MQKFSCTTIAPVKRFKESAALYTFFVWLSMLPLTSNSQNSVVIYKSPISDQLPQKAIRQVFQDNMGFMWFVSSEGIHRFDGNNIRSYTASADFQEFQISHNNVRGVTQDKTGTLWVATAGGGLIYYDPKNQTYQRATAPQSSEFAFNGENIESLFMDSRGLIWIGYREGFLAWLNPATKAAQLVSDTNISTRQNGSILDFTEDSSNRLWIATSLRGVISYDPDDPSTARVNSFPSLPPEDISAISIDELDNLWIGTSSKGILIYETNSNDPGLKILSDKQMDILSQSAINSIFVDDEEDVWIGTDTGLLVYNGEAGLRKLAPRRGDEFLVMDIIQDEAGDYWIGTHTGIYRAVKSQFQLYEFNRNFGNSGITSFAESKSGQIFIGTYQGLHAFEPMEHILKESDSLIGGFAPADQRIMTLDSDKQNLWIGYRHHGIEQVDLDSRRSNRIYSSNSHRSKAPGNSISKILATEESSVWIASLGQGISHLNLEDLTVRNWKHSDSHSISDEVYTFLYEEPKSLMVGTVAGLSSLSFEQHQISKITSIESPANLDNSVINVIHKDANGDLWLGTQYEGLFIWRKKYRNLDNVHIEKARTTRAMPSLTVYAIEEDEDGFLWISTANGLVRLNPQSMETIVFDQKDGLQADEFNFGASFKDSQGYLYFGGERGFNRFDPSKITIDAKPPKVVLTSATFADTVLEYDESYIETKALHLSHKDYISNFTFSALDYREHSQIEYKYLLKNSGSDWTNLGNQHSIGFTNLPSGIYTLRVRAAGPDGVWGDEGLDIDLYVHPPPWLNWYAFTVYSALLVGIGLLIRKYYDTYALMEGANRMALRMESTAESALDNLEEQLSTDQRLLDNLYTHSRSILDFLTHILKAQETNAQSPEVRQQFHNSRERVLFLMALEDNTQYLGDLLMVNFQSFVTQLADELCDLEVNPSLRVVPVVDMFDLHLPADIAVPAGLIIGELMANSMRHAFTDSSGVQTVGVKMRESEDHEAWVLEVSDSGTGLSAQLDPKQATTASMEVINYCVEKLGADYEVRRNKGAVFCFRIPRPVFGDQGLTN